MRQFLVAVSLLVWPVAAQAHFVFILPVDGRKAQVVFSDNLKPDRAELLKKIAHTKFSVRLGDKDTEIKATPAKDVLDIEPPGKGPVWVVGVCPYGVSTRGKEPILLNYYAKALVGSGPVATDKLLEQTFAALKLDVALVVEKKKDGDSHAIKVLWEGKPLADADVVLYVPGKETPVEKKSDKNGLVNLEKPAKAGLYGVCAAHTVKTNGKLGDKAYSAIRSYSTLTFPVRDPEKKTRGSRQSGFVAYRAEKEAKKAEGNPEATKLLADALAARATYADFPGFRADVVLNVEGKTAKGTVQVTNEGRAHLKVEGDQHVWAKEMLSSLISHRMADSTRTNVCSFPDEVTDHPLGRAIKVINDKFHSSYRIRDKQVIEVNRQMGDMRFTITVMENRQNAEKKYLPGNYVVNYWDAKSGCAKKSATHHNTWMRIGKYDLPLTATIVTAEDGKQVTRSIKLSGHALNK